MAAIGPSVDEPGCDDLYVSQAAEIRFGHMLLDRVDRVFERRRFNVDRDGSRDIDFKGVFHLKNLPFGLIVGGRYGI